MGLSDDEVQESCEHVDAHAIRAASLGLLTWPSVEPEQLSIPTMVIAGAKDERVQHALAFYHDNIANAGIALHILGGLDHGQTAEKSDLTLPLIRPFLRSSRVS